MCSCHWCLPPHVISLPLFLKKTVRPLNLADCQRRRAVHSRTPGAQWCHLCGWPFTTCVCILTQYILCFQCFKNIYRDTKRACLSISCIVLITVELVFTWLLTSLANRASMLLSFPFLRKREPIPASKVNHSLGNYSDLIPSHWVGYAGQCDRTLVNETSKILWRGFWESFLILESTERNSIVFCWTLSYLNVRHRMVQLSCYLRELAWRHAHIMMMAKQKYKQNREKLC